MSPTFLTTIWSLLRQTSWNKERTPVDGHVRIINPKQRLNVQSCAKLLQVYAVSDRPGTTREEFLLLKATSPPCLKSLTSVFQEKKTQDDIHVDRKDMVIQLSLCLQKWIFLLFLSSCKQQLHQE